MSDFERRKLAYQWEASLPDYVYQNKNGEWRWYESDIAKLPELVNPVKYYETVNENAKVPLSLTLEDICFPYVAGNPTFKKYSLLDFQNITGLNDQDEVFITIRRINNELEVRIPKILQRKAQFRAEFQKETAYRERFDKLQPIPFEELSVDMIVKVYQINIEFILGTVYTLFDKIKVSENIPLIVTEKFYKVLKGHAYDLEIPDESNLMFLFTFRGKVEIVQKEEFFELSYEYKKGEDDTEYLNMICKTIGVSRNNLVLGSERYNGLSFFPNQTLSPVIWRDFIMNEPVASRNFFMDEHQLGIRNREGRMNIRKGFYVFYTEKDVKTTFTLKEDDLAQGVRIRILNASSFEDAYVILRKIAKIFSLYNEVGMQIANEYNAIMKENLIVFNKPEYKQIQDKKTRIKDIAKDMFLPNYTRSCGFQPKIIPDSEVEKYSETHQVMRFPKEGDELEGKGYYFGCAHHKTHIYPGLRKNPMEENKNEYPILPCCYTVDQRNRRKCLFKEYYESDKKLLDFIPKEKEQVKNIQYRFLISDKFVGFEQTGKCPNEIENLFMLYTSSKPVRKGVHRSRQSALECVLLTTRYKNFHELDSASRLAMLEEELKRLQKMDLTICSQECWDIEEPQAYLTVDRYLDPRYFIRLLETVYNCRLVLFSREDFIHPEYIEGYLRWNLVSKSPIVMLYEHMGSEANKANYPQCELILLEKEEPDVSEWIYKDYLSSLQTIQPHSLPSEKYFTEGFLPDKIVGQHIDFYGKMYALNVQDVNNKTTTFYFDKQRFPILTGVPKTTVGYFSEGGQKMFMRNGYSIQVFSKSESSLLEQYNETRRQMELLVENAKRIYANQVTKNRERDWSWIEVNPNIKLDYSKYLFSSSEKVIVPNAETKRRLQYLLRVYGIRRRLELTNYSSMKNIMPFKYRTIHDFEEQDNAVIVDSSVQIDWFSNFYQAKKLDGTLYQESFIAVVQDKAYKCNPVEKLEGISYWVMVPQFKKIFKVGNAPNRRFLVLKNPDKTLQFYECQIIEV